jgi:hypothetical protein
MIEMDRSAHHLSFYLEPCRYDAEYRREGDPTISRRSEPRVCPKKPGRRSAPAFLNAMVARQLSFNGAAGNLYG